MVLLWTGRCPDFLCWPSEIWLRVFEGARPPDVTLNSYTHYDNFAQSEGILAYKQYLQLRRVCTNFNSIFTAHPELTTHLVICPLANADWDVQKCCCNLTTWSRGNSKTNSLTVCFPYGSRRNQEVFFSSLEHNRIKLSSISIAGPSRHLPCSETFANVVTCHICEPRGRSGGGGLELTFLKAMCNLQALTLQEGVFCSLVLPCSLTKLLVINGKLLPYHRADPSDWSEAGKLQELVLHKAEVDGMHKHGLCACTNLKNLELIDSAFGTGEGPGTVVLPREDFWHGRGFPPAMGRVSSLTSLYVSLPLNTMFCKDVQHMSQLCKLHLLCQGTHLTAELEQLTNLTELRVQAMSDFEINCTLVAVPAITVRFDWAKLCSLQSVTVAGPMVLGKAITSVCFLPHIRYFGFQQLRTGCPATCQHVAQMRQLFSSHAPHVLCEID